MKAIVKKTGKIVTTYSTTALCDSDTQTEFRILEDANTKYRACELDFIEDLWVFIAEWLPDYTHNANVALSDDIQCCLEAEADADKLQDVINACGDTPEEWEREQLRIDRDLLEEACDNYFRQIYGRDRCK